MLYTSLFLLVAYLLRNAASVPCSDGESMTYNRWSGVIPDQFTPVFVYSASGDEVSLTWTCLARCFEIDECAGVVVAYGRSGCQGVAMSDVQQFSVDSDVAFFQKICLKIPETCANKWWVLETTPGYNLNSETSILKSITNTTLEECNKETLAFDEGKTYRSAQWTSPDPGYDTERITFTRELRGTCLVKEESKYTEPESYRVSNYRNFYVENQCRHDYSQKIERCSYEEYSNQTLKHVEFTTTNYTKDECKTLCEQEDRFICRGFSWTLLPGRGSGSLERGLCDLHSEDLVSTGSWLLRRSSYATYFRRVICLNISVICEGSDIVVRYTPRTKFRGRVYVPGRSEQCSASGSDGLVTLKLPLYGNCEVNFAYSITNGQDGVINRTMAYAMIMIQNNPIIQTAGDRWVRVGCSPGDRGPATLQATLSVADNSKPSVGGTVGTPSAASAVLNTGGGGWGGAGALTLYVTRADGAVGRPDPVLALGEPLELRIDATADVEIEAYHLVASSRLGDSSVLLLDGRGCSTGQVDFPAFTRSYKGGIQRLSARFKAFRFPNSHIVKFSLMVRQCDGRCVQVDCSIPARAARNSNLTLLNDGSPLFTNRDAATSGVVAEGTVTSCHEDGGRVPMELEMVVGSKDHLVADNLVNAGHQNSELEELSGWGGGGGVGGSVCLHEVVLVAMALVWLAVQLLLLLACCLLVKKYRNLAALSMQKDYHSFDNVGFEAGCSHRRVHWPDQTVDVIHAH